MHLIRKTTLLIAFDWLADWKQSNETRSSVTVTGCKLSSEKSFFIKDCVSEVAVYPD